ncbi:MAG: hypothetical protein E7344_01830 [Clostridiales bacterium]|nr:hypothetical protein [Clostridiales bacterium]
MKKIFSVFCVIYLAMLLLPCNASALSGSWYRVENENVVFFKQPVDTDNNKLFLLEKTYYIYAISSTNNFLQAEIFDNVNGFVKICGYVKANEVVPCTTPPVLPYYPTEILTVNQSNAILKAQPNVYGEDIGVAFNGQNVCFYGKSWNNPSWYYVKYQNDFGYVQSRQLSPLLIALHPTPIYVPEPEPEPGTDQTDNEQTQNIKQSLPFEAILILLVCIPAVIIVLIMFLPQKRTQNRQVPKPKYMSESDTFDDLDLL